MRKVYKACQYSLEVDIQVSHLSGFIRTGEQDRGEVQKLKGLNSEWNTEVH